jgi:polyferredoxin
MKGRYADKNILSHVFRPRVLVYITILLTVMTAFLFTLSNRVPMRTEVIRDRLTLSRSTEDGRLENLYTVQILNMQDQPHKYKITATGADDIQVVADEKDLKAGPQQSINVPVRLLIDPINLKGPSTPVMIRVQAEDNPELISETKSSFLRR